MPLVFEKQAVWTRAMPITRLSAGIDGGCASSPVSARSEFARPTSEPCDSRPLPGAIANQLLCCEPLQNREALLADGAVPQAYPFLAGFEPITILRVSSHSRQFAQTQCNSIFKVIPYGKRKARLVRILVK